VAAAGPLPDLSRLSHSQRELRRRDSNTLAQASRFRLCPDALQTRGGGGYEDAQLRLADHRERALGGGGCRAARGPGHPAARAVNPSYPRTLRTMLWCELGLLPVRWAICSTHPWPQPGIRPHCGADQIELVVPGQTAKLRSTVRVAAGAERAAIEAAVIGGSRHRPVPDRGRSRRFVIVPGKAGQWSCLIAGRTASRRCRCCACGHS